MIHATIEYFFVATDRYIFEFYLVECCLLPPNQRLGTIHGFDDHIKKKVGIDTRSIPSLVHDLTTPT
jgi:hypothetical protein